MLDAHEGEDIAKIVELQRIGRSVLVGTASVVESEELAAGLAGEGIEREILNAKNDEREAWIVARAATPGAVTLSTNMAGRGTDIRLGGDPPRERNRIVDLGGLYVLGTNRHESRRIDAQLRGRAGRQGDPGCSRFYVSLEDDLVKRFGIRDLIPPHYWTLRRDEPIDDPAVTRVIGRAQRTIEAQTSRIRRTLWRYASSCAGPCVAEKPLDFWTPVGSMINADCHRPALDRTLHSPRPWTNS